MRSLCCSRTPQAVQQRAALDRSSVARCSAAQSMAPAGYLELPSKQDRQRGNPDKATGQPNRKQQTNSKEKTLTHFFPSNAFMASARSSNTFNCMLQNRVNWLINAYKAACRLRGFKRDRSGKGPVHSPVCHEVIKNPKQQQKPKQKNHTTKQNTATQNKTAKQRCDRCQFTG